MPVKKVKSVLRYRAFSFYELFRSIFLNGCLFVAAFYALLHLEENPVVISVFAALCLLGVLVLGDDQIIVYNDKVVHKTNSLWAYFFNTAGNVYLIETIESAFVDTLLPNVFDTAVMGALNFVLKNKGGQQSSPIYIRLKTGETITLNMRFTVEKNRRIVREINAAVGNVTESHT